MLIIAPTETWFASAIRAELAQARVTADVLTDPTGLIVTIRSDSQHSAPQVVIADRTGAPYSAVVNLGVPAPADGAAETRPFRRDEWVAAWWTALACFPGRVVNRPDEDALLPADSVQRRVPVLTSDVAFWCAAAQGELLPPLATHQQRNAYDEWTGVLTFRLQGGATAPSDDSGVGLRLVDYEPLRVEQWVAFGGNMWPVAERLVVRPKLQANVLRWLGRSGDLATLTIEGGAQGTRVLAARVPSQPADVGVSAPSVLGAVVDFVSTPRPRARLVP